MTTRPTPLIVFLGGPLGDTQRPKNAPGRWPLAYDGQGQPLRAAKMDRMVRDGDGHFYRRSAFPTTTDGMIDGRLYVWGQDQNRYTEADLRAYATRVTPADPTEANR